MTKGVSILLLAAGLTFGADLPGARAQSTIDTTFAYAWGANTGWTNWRPDATNGVRIGEYVCSGYVYSANCGWINLGSGTPVNGIQYQNNSATDFGVNYFPTAVPGVAILRGYAYGANIGWINFEAQGNPSVNLLNGQLYGYAYSANTGWINLGTMTTQVVKTLSIAPGLDTDGDGIADAFERTYFSNSLTSANATSDSDGDGMSDLQEYLEGTDPTSANSLLRITAVAKVSTVIPPILNVTFSSTPARVYRIERSATIVNPTWSDAGLGNFLPDAAATSTRTVAGGSPGQQFFRVKALRLGL